MGHSGHTNRVRLNKFIADSGIASRRKADLLIEEGKVMVNGKKVFELGSRIDPQNDRVTVEGKPIQEVDEKIYIAFHKPKNVVTSMNDPEGRPSVADFFDKFPVRVFPVGRLDWDSEGLLIITNDGEFAQSVSHPKSEVTKTYMVKLDSKPTDEKLQKLRHGISIIGGKVAAKHVERVKGRGSKEKDWIRIVITEGKNRQIRRMFEKIGCDVQKLQRISIGSLELGNLERGNYKVLNPNQVNKIFTPDYKTVKKEIKPVKRSEKRAPTPMSKKQVKKKAKELFGD